MKNRVYEKILGCLHGYAIGASLGMPAMLWTQNRVWTYFDWIHDFMPGAAENDASMLLKAGQYSDNVKQSIVLMDTLIACQGTAVEEIISYQLTEWAKTKAVHSPLKREILQCSGDVMSLSPVHNLSSHSVMRIAPAGCLFLSKGEGQFIDNIKACGAPTHASDIALAGAAVIAWAISRAVDFESWENIKMELPILADQIQTTYESTFSPSLKRRISFALQFSDKLKTCNDRNILRELYDCLGAGETVIETVPMVLAIVNIAEGDPLRAASLAANLGGNTDVIAALSAAICGALSGVQVFPQAMIDTINDVNQIDFSEYAKSFVFLRDA